jgi:hypothetical protein
MNETHFYGRFNELFGGQQATDRVRNQKMPAVGPTLDYLGSLPPLPWYAA